MSASLFQMRDSGEYWPESQNPIAAGWGGGYCGDQRRSDLAKTAAEMIAAFAAFVAGPDDVSTMDNLYRLTDGYKVLSVEDKASVVPSMFRLMERCPDADLGNPGPLVHSIESIGIPAYEGQLTDSIRRRPMYLNIWMLNRILNITPDGPQRAAYLTLLERVRDDPKWAGSVIAEAAGYLDHQAKRPRG